MSAGLTDAGPSPARMTWLLVGLVTLAGLVVRAIPLALSDFPVNDGGLFVAMTQAIQDAGWSLPATVAWNGTDLPFTYPPLAFYKVGLLNSLFGLDLVDVFRWLPLVFSFLVVPAVYLLARELLRSELAALVAALTYALAPSSYVWMIQGGGVTRSPGMLLAVLALWQVLLLVRDPTRGRAVGVGILAGLTALLHPGAAVFLGLGAALLLVFEGRTRQAALHAAVAVGVALVVVSPWLVIVASRHGLPALMDVPSNGPDLRFALLTMLSSRFTGLPFFDPLGVIGIAMAVVCLAQRRWLLPVWFLVATALSPQYATVPFGLLVGGAVLELDRRRRAATAPQLSSTVRRMPAVALAVVAACLLFEGVVSAVAVLDPGAPVHALSAERREAMAWVAGELEPEATVAVITNSVWPRDPDSEWFPLLTNRRSVATVQGTEWLGQAEFNETRGAHHTLQTCVDESSVSCVEDWLVEWPADYLYLPKGRLHGPNSPADCCAGLRASLLADPNFAVVLDGAGATIFAVASGVSAEIP
jgi:4-amino-4-deoxy-L-arabinose transferase-like glycosyltransferase